MHKDAEITVMELDKEFQSKYGEKFSDIHKSHILKSERKEVLTEKQKEKILFKKFNESIKSKWEETSVKK